MRNPETYIPADLDDAIQFFLEQQDAQGLEKIRGFNEDEWLALTHHGTGTAIRNAWNLWGASDDKSKHLHNWFVARGVAHPDDMSGIILRSIHRHARGTQIQLEEQIKHYSK